MKSPLHADVVSVQTLSLSFNTPLITRRPVLSLNPDQGGLVQFESMIERLREFGKFRERDDPKDMFGPESFGFHYVHQSCLTAIIFRKMESYWLLETAACARVGLRPSEDLFRRVSQWATTSGIVSCNLVEDGLGQAAALVSGRVSVDELGPWHRTPHLRWIRSAREDDLRARSSPA